MGRGQRELFWVEGERPPCGGFGVGLSFDQVAEQSGSPAVVAAGSSA